ncbi:amino acid ABC transporter ATP-binding protein [Mycobacterium sp. KBS0706]|uniref:amino acid ABC transporter ATP-binding protein n=1 Tax=Mycobacterium sp. KBS0706 TaxID=2578109 RepID=UPI00110F94FA|nr:amino acid ABC transporter ATP-binding protein [Mycobacterium sp. KBS0706]TSD85215.1 amino acid ABC transporter ATP-binding protein [Mycobacterium sp. KBS0706]
MTRRALIQLTGVTKQFGATRVLKGVDLEIDQSEVVCIVGPSGSGKSTLLRCMVFLEEHDAGEIRIDGEPIGFVTKNGKRQRMGEAGIRKARRNVGMVFQQFNLWPHMTALGNVAEALIRVRRLPRAEAAQKAQAALDRVGLAGKGGSYPSQLSGGQQQRVAIARALAMEPEIMLFDEPTSSLDPELVGEVLEVMRALARDGMTMVVVTHEMGFAAQVATSVVFVDEGRILAKGPPRQIFLEDGHARIRQFLDNYRRRNAFWQDAPAEAVGG